MNAKEGFSAGHKSMRAERAQSDIESSPTPQPKPHVENPVEAKRQEVERHAAAQTELTAVRERLGLGHSASTGYEFASNPEVLRAVSDGKQFRRSEEMVRSQPETQSVVSPEHVQSEAASQFESEHVQKKETEMPIEETANVPEDDKSGLTSTEQGSEHVAAETGAVSEEKPSASASNEEILDPRERRAREWRQLVHESSLQTERNRMVADLPATNAADEARFEQQSTNLIKRFKMPQWDSNKVQEITLKEGVNVYAATKRAVYDHYATQLGENPERYAYSIDNDGGTKRFDRSEIDEQMLFRLASFAHEHKRKV
jgi:hypothetical protein